MKFAITHPLVTHPYHPDLVTGAGVAAVATAAEAAGFHGFGFTDHPAPSQRWLDGGGHDALDPFVALGFAAAHTTTLRLIPNIVVLPYRNPFVVAKASACQTSAKTGPSVSRGNSERCGSSCRRWVASVTTPAPGSCPTAR